MFPWTLVVRFTKTLSLKSTVLTLMRFQTIVNIATFLNQIVCPMTSYLSRNHSIIFSLNGLSLIARHTAVNSSWSTSSVMFFNLISEPRNLHDGVCLAIMTSYIYQLVISRSVRLVKWTGTLCDVTSPWQRVLPSSTRRVRPTW